VLAHFLTSFKVYNATLVNSTSREEVGDQLAYAMKLIIIPLLSRSFELGQHEIVADATVDSMVKDMFDPAEEVQGEVAPGATQGVLEFNIITIIIFIIIYYYCYHHYHCHYHYCCFIFIFYYCSYYSYYFKVSWNAHTDSSQQQEQLGESAAVKQPSKLGYDHSSM